MRKCVNILKIRVRYHFYEVFGIKQTFSEISGYPREKCKTYRKIFSSFIVEVLATCDINIAICINDLREVEVVVEVGEGELKTVI